MLKTPYYATTDPFRTRFTSYNLHCLRSKLLVFLPKSCDITTTYIVEENNLSHLYLNLSVAGDKIKLSTSEINFYQNLINTLIATNPDMCVLFRANNISYEDDFIIPNPWVNQFLNIIRQELLLENKIIFDQRKKIVAKLREQDHFRFAEEVLKEEDKNDLILLLSNNVIYINLENDDTFTDTIRDLNMNILEKLRDFYRRGYLYLNYPLSLTSERMIAKWSLQKVGIYKNVYAPDWVEDDIRNNDGDGNGKNKKIKLSRLLYDNSKWSKFLTDQIDNSFQLIIPYVGNSDKVWNLEGKYSVNIYEDYIVLNSGEEFNLEKVKDILRVLYL